MRRQDDNFIAIAFQLGCCACFFKISNGFVLVDDSALLTQIQANLEVLRVARLSTLHFPVSLMYPASGEK